MSFINERVLPTGLTFDDVLLVPAYSEVLPREVSTVGRFSRNIQLNIPIVSAAMDTVTEAPLAIALAREGGIGVIHKNMSIAAQAAHVRRVKRAESGMIYDPVTIKRDNTVGDALQLMQEGAKWRLYIPYDMAYGEHGAGEMIPPYSALVFDVELIKVL